MPVYPVFVKTLLSPLPWLLLICVARSAIGLLRNETARQKAADLTLLLFALGTWLLSCPAVSDTLAKSLWVDREGRWDPNRRAVVVVLAGGFFPSDDGQSHLSEATVERLLTGVRAFRESHASRIVMSGSGGFRRPSAQVELMRELAIMLGVPRNQIAVDPWSRNTFEHPREVLRAGLAIPSDEVIVVTEPIHLHRAMMEFQMLFPFSIPFATPRHVPADATAVGSWIPELDALKQSTRSLREWTGIVWYSANHLVSHGLPGQVSTGKHPPL